MLPRPAKDGQTMSEHILHKATGGLPTRRSRQRSDRAKRPSLVVVIALMVSMNVNPEGILIFSRFVAYRAPYGPACRVDVPYVDP